MGTFNTLGDILDEVEFERESWRSLQHEGRFFSARPAAGWSGRFRRFIDEDGSIWTRAERRSHMRQHRERAEEIEGAIYDVAHADRDEPIIPDSDFEDYAGDMADQIYEGADSPYFDVEKFAADLRHDYTEFTFDGVDYLILAQ